VTPNPRPLESDLGSNTNGNSPHLEASPQSRSGLDLWLHRSAALLFVLLCAGVGVAMIFLPWTMQWTDNYFLTRIPGLRPVVANGFVRGLCSGLGVLDLWIGFSEAINYQEDRPPKR
jgi:hypothetical protein